MLECMPEIDERDTALLHRGPRMIFDDLLIGNFIKVTLHGEWGPGRLYPDFSPFVAKYGDNGRAHTLKELREFHWSYFRRAPASTSGIDSRPAS